MAAKPGQPGQPGRKDCEYQRLGVCNVFMACEPLAGWRLTQVTQPRTKADWTHFIEDIAKSYAQVQRINLVMDNLNIHALASLYKALAQALWDSYEFVQTPRHGSLFNMTEIEINVKVRQCLNAA